jgi:Peptidase_C39 like family
MLSKYLTKLKSVNPKKYLVVLASIGVAGAGINSGLNKPVPEVSKDKIVAVSKELSPTQSQRDNYTMPNRSCNSSSNAMFLNFYRPLLQRDGDFVPDDAYLASVLRRGDTIYHNIQTDTLKAYGLDTIWEDDGDLNRIKKIAEQGYPLVVNIVHRGKVEGHGFGALRGSGHMILIRSFDRKTGMFTIADPYGNLATGYPADSNPAKGNYQMSASEFSIRHQGGYRRLSNKQADALGLDHQ